VSQELAHPLTDPPLCFLIGSEGNGVVAERASLFVFDLVFIWDDFSSFFCGFDAVSFNG
jgi:hypothetical protein